MKHLYRVGVLALLAGFATWSCTPTGGQATSPTAIELSPTLERVKGSSTIKAGIIVYPPFVTKDANTGTYGGYFVELMDEMAKHMSTDQKQVKMEYEETTWGGMVAGLTSKRYDVVVSGIFSTIPRALEVTWAKPTMYVGMSALVRRDDNRFQTPQDFEKSPINVAVAAGEVGHEYVKHFLPNAKPIVLQTSDTATPALEVLRGNADAAFAESVALVRFAKEHPEVKVLFVEQPLFTYATSVMVRRDDANWLDFLNRSIEFLQLAGVTDRLDRKYNPNGDLWLTPTKPWVSRAPKTGS